MTVKSAAFVHTGLQFPGIFSMTEIQLSKKVEQIIMFRFFQVDSAIKLLYLDSIVRFLDLKFVTIHLIMYLIS